MTIRDVAVLLIAGLGVLTLLISSYGLVRFQGVHQRMQTASVGASLGITSLLISAGLYYAGEALFWRMLALVVLFFLTGPIATTAMARAAYRKQGESARRHFVVDDMSNPDYLPDYRVKELAGAGEEEVGVS